jgi:hypothetical protein
MYAPAFTTVRLIRQHQLDARHVAYLLGDVHSVGSIRYAYLLAIHRDGAREALAFVSSEDPGSDDDLLGELGMGADDFAGPTEGNFLCVFREEGHFNLGASPDWLDEGKFERRALELARELLAQAPR